MEAMLAEMLLGGRALDPRVFVSSVAVLRPAYLQHYLPRAPAKAIRRCANHLVFLELEDRVARRLVRRLRRCDVVKCHSGSRFAFLVTLDDRGFFYN